MFHSISLLSHPFPSGRYRYGFLGLYSTGVVLNACCITLIARNWKTRKASHGLLLNLFVTYGVTCLIYLTLEMLMGVVNMFQKLVLFAIMLILCHSGTNLILILTVQNILKTVKPFDVALNITKKSTERSIQLQWLLFAIIYVPILILLFVSKEDKILELLSITITLIYIVIFITSVVILILDISLCISSSRSCFKKAEDTLSDGNATELIVMTRSSLVAPPPPPVAQTFSAKTARLFSATTTSTIAPIPAKTISSCKPHLKETQKELGNVSEFPVATSTSLATVNLTSSTNPTVLAKANKPRTLPESLATATLSTSLSTTQATKIAISETDTTKMTATTTTATTTSPKHLTSPAINSEIAAATITSRRTSDAATTSLPIITSPTQQTTALSNTIDEDDTLVFCILLNLCHTILFMFTFMFLISYPFKLLKSTVLVKFAPSIWAIVNSLLFLLKTFVKS